MRRSSPFLLVVIVAALPTPLLAQLAITARAADLSVGGRLHVQYTRSSADGDAGGVDAVDDVLVRRARINIDIRVGDVFDARIEPDFGGGGAGVGLADLYARLTLARAFRVSAGQFKRAFSALELSSSTDLPIIERDARIEGVSGCPGVGGVCTFSRMSERLQFDDRDLGLRAEGDLGTRVQYLATMTNGEGRNASDVNDSKSASGRVVLVTGTLRLGAFGGVHDYLRPDTTTHHAQAFGADLELGTWRKGFHLLAGVMGGDNWMAGPTADFSSAQAMASVYLPLQPAGRFAAVEPVFRAGWTSTDTAAGADYSALVITPGISLYVAGKNWVGMNLDWYDPSSGASSWSLKTQAFVYF